MEWLLNIAWRGMFVPDESPLEMVVRGTIMWLAIFVMMRVFRRQAGAIGIADLLVIVIIADAAQNGMAGDAKSVTSAIVLVVTIIFWDYLFDYLGFKSKAVRRVLEPKKLELVRDGRLIRENLDSEMLTEEDLLAQLRLQGIDGIADVKQCNLEGSGKFSVILKELPKEQQNSNANDTAGVN